MAFVFFIALAFFIFNSLGGAATKSTSGLVQGVAGGIENIQVFLSDKEELIAKNAKLQQEMDTLAVQIGIQDILQERNEDLLEQLGREEDGPRIVAGVTKRPPVTPYDVYQVDAGEAQGVVVGDVALYADYIVLGQVESVSQESAKVDLFSAPHIETNVILNNALLTARGQGNGILRIDTPRDFEVVVGDEVLLPGYNLYIIGRVVDVVGDAQDSFKHVVVQSPINIQAVSLVTLVPYTKDNEVAEISETP